MNEIRRSPVLPLSRRAKLAFGLAAGLMATEGTAMAQPDLAELRSHRPRVDSALNWLEPQLMPIAAWRERAQATLHFLLGTPSADAAFLELRQELQGVVAQIAKDFEAQDFQRLLWPDGAAAQAYRRASNQPVAAGPSEKADAHKMRIFLGDRGVWVGLTEGVTSFRACEGWLFEHFHLLVTEKIWRFLMLWSDEEVSPVLPDGRVPMTLDELLFDVEARIAATEDYLTEFPDSPVIGPVRARHLHYLALYLGGTSTIPAFDPKTDVMSRQVRQRFEAYAASRPLAGSARVVNDYLRLLRAADFRRTPEITRFVDSLRERSDPKLRDY